MKIFKRTVLLLLSLSMFCIGVVGCGDEEDDSESGLWGSSFEAGPWGSSSELPLVKYQVTLDYNDGSGKKEVLSIAEGESLRNYLSHPTNGNKEVVGWSLLPEGENCEVLVYEDMVLYAQWKTFEPVVYTSAFEISSIINHKYVEIRPEASVTALDGKVLRIGAGVKSISFISDGTLYSNFAIMINERTTDLDIVLDNFCFGMGQPWGIKGETTGVGYTVNVDVRGIATIDGSKYVSQNLGGGATCIDVPNLTISGGGSLLLCAGHGYNGMSRSNASDGQHGENGEAGTDGGCGIIANSVEVNNIILKIVGGNGGHGGNGGNGNNTGGLSSSGKYRKGGDGGNGGKGGDAVRAQMFYSRGAQLEFKAGNGGNGGNGGGSSSTYAGNGGNGGNGGKGGSTFVYTISMYDAVDTITEYVVGNGGNGGYGGDSAHNSKKGIAGANGPKGDNYVG